MHNKINWPALCHAIALFIAFDVRYLNAHLGLVWVFPHLLGCGLMLAGKSKAASREQFTCQHQPFLVAWLLTILFCWLVSATGVNSPGLVFSLLALPTLALSMQPEYLPGYLKATFVILALYGCMLIVEWVTGFRPADPNAQYAWLALNGVWQLHKAASAWPLTDPNNAALAINCALIPCVWLATRRKIWWLAVLFFSAALICTASKAGLTVAFAISSGLIVYQARERLPTIAALVFLALGIGAAMTQMPIQRNLAISFDTRLTMWKDALKIFDVSGFWGIGMGMFNSYYRYVRTETLTSGTFAHNDLLQIALEMGPWALGIFAGMLVYAYLTTRRGNLAAAGVITAVLLQSLCEFQFYVPVISLLAGLAFAYHKCHRARV